MIDATRGPLSGRVGAGRLDGPQILDCERRNAREHSDDTRARIGTGRVERDGARASARGAAGSRCERQSDHQPYSTSPSHAVHCHLESNHEANAPGRDCLGLRPNCRGRPPRRGISPPPSHAGFAHGQVRLVMTSARGDSRTTPGTTVLGFRPVLTARGQHFGEKVANGASRAVAASQVTKAISPNPAPVDATVVQIDDARGSDLTGVDLDVVHHVGQLQADCLVGVAEAHDQYENRLSGLLARVAGRLRIATR